MNLIIYYPETDIIMSTVIKDFVQYIKHTREFLKLLLLPWKKGIFRSQFYITFG